MSSLNTVLIGAQWGDEGKGKIIDVLTEHADWVVRYQGGSNAGHTVEIGGVRYVLHLVPSGIFRRRTRNVIGNGVVVDPLELVKELRDIRRARLPLRGRFFLSDRAHLVMPWHRVLDASRESKLGVGKKIGTTQRGIGPAYTDKAQRAGLRAHVLGAADLPELLRERFIEANRVLKAHGLPVLPARRLTRELLSAARALAPYVCDATVLLNDAIDRGESVLFEGAQGTMLDVDFGTYPFVTSSNATAGGACVGTGVPPHRIDRVIGVVKAYTTRVGEGPFPTELADDTGRKLRDIGREYGATTGRPRRCGWFDAVVARHAARINGVDAWALTKLDVLDGFETVRVCVGYRVGKRVGDHVPADVRRYELCRPLYEEIPGWKGTVRGAKRWADLPAGARAYIRRLEHLTGVPVGILSIGPGRENTLVLDRRRVHPPSAPLRQGFLPRAGASSSDRRIRRTDPGTSRGAGNPQSAIRHPLS